MHGWVECFKLEDRERSPIQAFKTLEKFIKIFPHEVKKIRIRSPIAEFNNQIEINQRSKGNLSDF